MSVTITRSNKNVIKRKSDSSVKDSLEKYEKMLEELEKSDNLTINHLTFNNNTKELEYSLPADLEEDKFPENLPVKVGEPRAYQTFKLKESTVIDENDDEQFRLEVDVDPSVVISDTPPEGDYIDITGILDNRYGYKYKQIREAIDDYAREIYGEEDSDGDPYIRGAKHGNSLFKVYRPKNHYKTENFYLLTSGRRLRDDTVKGQLLIARANANIDNKYNKQKNEAAKDINDFNRKYNEQKAVKQQVYDDVIKIADQTKGSDYTDQRDKIRVIKKLEEAGIGIEDSKKILSDVEETFKDFYRSEKLKKFDFEDGSELGYANTKVKPPSGNFDPDYYKKQTLPNQGMTEEERWAEAVADDDIDIIERYGAGTGENTLADREEGFYKWRYGQQRGVGEVRGNAAELLDDAESYVEKAPTDAEIQMYRDKMLEIEKDDPAELINSVDYVRDAYETAIAAKRDDIPNRFVDAAGPLLNIDNADEFLLVYRNIGTDEEKEYLKNFDNENYYVTDLEDQITGVVGEEALLKTKKFGALTQNVLTDTINELKRAKLKEQELGLYNSFSTFGEIMDVNKTLTDSLLGDSGIGGYLPFMGKDSGFDRKTLEKQLSGVTGVNNNVVYNWENWFENSIQKKYGEFEDEYMELGYTAEEAEEAAEQIVNIQKSFAQSYINDYLKPRFDESRSMNEFIEYLDVSEEEQNPFQTQSLVNAVNQVGELQAKAYLDQIRDSAVDKKFDSDFYFNPVGAGMSEGLQTKYDTQKKIVEEDWRRARENPQVLIRGGDVNAPTWAEVAYQYGVDVEDKEEFAKLHYQVKGRLEDFDPAEDVINAGRVKDYIYKDILPKLVEEAGNQPNIFGQFVKPDEYADDMLEGLDPNVPESWEAALTGSDGESLIKDFQGDFSDLKSYISESFRTGSAADIRAQIKFLNEKREKPTQELLGVEYIQREEDYKTDATLEGTTQLFKTFQSAGYEGTEDEFYENVFPDLDPSTQTLLTEVGEKGTFNLGGLGSDFGKDPFEAFATVSKFAGDDNMFGLGKQKQEEDDEDDNESRSSYFSLGMPYDDEEEDYKSKKGSEILGQFTKGFSSFF